MGKYTYSSRCAKPGCKVWLLNRTISKEKNGCSHTSCEHAFFCASHVAHEEHLNFKSGIRRVPLEERMNRVNLVNERRRSSLSSVEATEKMTTQLCNHVVDALLVLRTDWDVVKSFKFSQEDSVVCSDCKAVCAFFAYMDPGNKQFSCDQHRTSMQVPVRFVDDKQLERICDSLQQSRNPKKETLSATLASIDGNRFVYTANRSYMTLQEVHHELLAIGTVGDLRNFKRGNYCHVYPTQSDTRVFELLSNVWPKRRYITIHDACIVMTGLGRNKAQLGAGFHVDRLPPRVLSFAIRPGNFDSVIADEEIVSFWFMVADQDFVEFSELIQRKYGRNAQRFLPTSLDEAKEIQRTFGRRQEVWKLQIVGQRSGELIQLEPSVWHAVLNVLPVFKLSWDQLRVQDFAEVVKLRRNRFSHPKAGVDFSNIEKHIKDMI